MRQRAFSYPLLLFGVVADFFCCIASHSPRFPHTTTQTSKIFPFRIVAWPVRFALHVKYIINWNETTKQKQKQNWSKIPLIELKLECSFSHRANLARKLLLILVHGALLNAFHCISNGIYRILIHLLVVFLLLLYCVSLECFAIAMCSAQSSHRQQQQKWCDQY